MNSLPHQYHSILILQPEAKVHIQHPADCPLLVLGPYSITMVPVGEALAVIIAVYLAGTVLSHLTRWIRYQSKASKFPLAHDIGFWERIFTRKANEEFLVDFRNLMRKGLAKVRHHLLDV